MRDILPHLDALARQYGAQKLVLFGSRARGTARERSDIDLAAFGVGQEKQGLFRLAADELPTLLKIDLVFITPETSPALLSEIERDGVVIYEAREQAR